VATIPDPYYAQCTDCPWHGWSTRCVRYHDEGRDLCPACWTPVLASLPPTRDWRLFAPVAAVIGVALAVLVLVGVFG
jgi:hypothetical protein